MNTEASTLYKLMILYMLSKVNFPMSNTQISELLYAAGSFKFISG